MKNLIVFFSVFLFVFLFGSQSNAQENKKADEVFVQVDEMPEYPGGETALRKDVANAVKYPEEAKKKGISGKVYVTFVVNELGKIENSRIARGVDPLLDKEALRVMSLLKTWKPGKQDEKAVKVSYTMPINFALNDNKEQDSKGDQKKVIDEKEVFFIVEDMPEFPGGENALREFISKSVKYPEQAKKENISGKVYVSFTVSSDGSVTDATIARGVHPFLDKEAIRVVNELPLWKPGKQRGTAVNVRYTVPISFVLDGKEGEKEIIRSDKTDEQVFLIVENMPEFPGGEEALKNKIADSIIYPEQAKKEGIQGKVYISFVVSKEGSVKQAKVARGVCPSLDKEAIRVVSELPNWKPGSQRGIAVNVQYTIPIIFELGAE